MALGSAQRTRQADRLQLLALQGRPLLGRPLLPPGRVCRLFACSPGERGRCGRSGPETARALRILLQRTNLAEGAEVFRNARGAPLTRDGVAYLLAKHLRGAAQGAPSFAIAGSPPTCSATAAPSRSSRPASKYASSVTISAT